MVGKFLARRVSRDVSGTYVPPFYQLPGAAVIEVCECMNCNQHCTLSVMNCSHCITE